tara:strand:- start:3674 stop:4765 length:1092 start_codon:yes stop_codon:yes gene_type:complete
MKFLKRIGRGISKAFKGLKKAVKKITFKKAFKVIAALGVALVAPALIGNMMTGLGGAMASSSSALVSTIGQGISSLGTMIGGTAATSSSGGFLSRTFSSVSGSITSGIEKVQGFFTNPTKAGTELIRDLAVDKAQEKFEEKTGIDPELLGAVVQQGAAFAGGITDKGALEEITVTAKRRGPLGDASPSREGLGQQAAITIGDPLKDAVVEDNRGFFAKAIDKLESEARQVTLKGKLQEGYDSQMAEYKKQIIGTFVGTEDETAYERAKREISSAQDVRAASLYTPPMGVSGPLGDTGAGYMTATAFQSTPRGADPLASVASHAPSQNFIDSRNQIMNDLSAQGVSFGPRPDWVANAYHFQPIV